MTDFFVCFYCMIDSSGHTEASPAHSQTSKIDRFAKQLLTAKRYKLLLKTPPC